MELPSFHKVFFLPAMTKQQLQRHGFAAAWAVVVSILAINCQADGFYSHQEIRQQAASFLTKQYAAQGKLEVSIGNLDSRLRLPHCSQALDFSAQDTANSGGNLSVQTQCRGTPRWSTHIPAQVRIYREIPVASRDLSRGQTLNTADISWETREISQYRQEYLTKSEDILQLEAKRNIGKGTLFFASALNAPKVIKRGDQVALSSNIAGINVTSSGTAMSDGRIGERIRIKNNQSARVISGTVVAEGKVVTL